MTSAAGWHAAELVYCSNVHPGDDLDAVIAMLGDFTAPVAEQRGLQQAGTGLWLNQAVARELDSQPAALARFRTALQQHHIQLFTLNGFPYGNFHAAVVKEKVYQPDWSQPERYDYTLQLARILADCLPEHTDTGTISTLPLGFKPEWNADKQEAAEQQLCRLAAALADLEQHSGKHIRVCLEMEPGCVLEQTPEAIAFFTEQLPAAAGRYQASMKHIQRYLGLCYDVCHQAVMFEQPAESLTAIMNADIAIGKIQVSSALEVHAPADASTQSLVNSFAEPKYLHQTCARDSSNHLQSRLDLPAALSDSDFPRDVPWRTHFHVPIQTTTLLNDTLGTTQPAIKEVLDFLQAHTEIRPHLEVETYTWQVLPEALRPQDSTQLIQGLSQELHWLQGELAKRNLLLP